MAKLSAGDVVSVSSLVKRGVSNVEIARLLGVSEGAVRYQRRRLEAGAVDGRTRAAPLPAARKRQHGEHLVVYEAVARHQGGVA